ncbi:MAG: hypothetical protein ACKOC7_02495, partial [Sphingomonadales bacterium]
MVIGLEKDNIHNLLGPGSRYRGHKDLHLPRCMNLAYKFKPNCCLLGVLLSGLIYTQPCITTVHAASIERFGYSLTTLDTVPVSKPAPTTMATTDTFQIKRSKD